MPIQTALDSISQNQGSPFGFKNRIINGGMVIDQRNAGASVTPTSGDVTLDRYRVYMSQASKFSVQQNSGSVTPPNGFSNYLGVVSSSSYSVQSSDYFTIRQRIEGYNFADMGWGTTTAKPVTLSFWVRSSLTGTFSGVVMNAAGNRSYPFTYTITNANTWEYETVIIPGDTTGTWVGATNGTGVQIIFGLGAGSTYNGTSGAWAGAEYYGATGSVNLVATNAATWYITGIQVESGRQATSFDYRPYGTELALCMRYFQSYKNAAFITGPLLNNAHRTTIPLLVVPMRTAPSLTFYDMNGNSGYLTEFSSQTQRTVQTWSSNGSAGYLGGGYVQTTTNFGNAAEVRFEANSEL